MNLKYNLSRTICLASIANETVEIYFINMSVVIFCAFLIIPYFVDRKICGSTVIFEKTKTRSLASGLSLPAANLALWPNSVAI